MQYDLQDRRSKAAQLARQQSEDLYPKMGRLFNGIKAFVEDPSVDFDDKTEVVAAMQQLLHEGTTSSVSMTDRAALKQLLESDKLSKGVKRALARLINDADLEYIKVSEDENTLGTPEEVLRGRDRITNLENELQAKTQKFDTLLDGPIHVQLDAFAVALGLGPVDNENTEDLLERIKVARANGAQPTNPVPAPQPAPAGGTQPPAPAPTTPPAPPTGPTTPPAAPGLGTRLKNVFIPQGE
jgi:hypothetical protein